ncbi:DMT family transporter [Ornithinimicrobium sufpigmenti]|uniref:DMT family transporter n=1 Tax=Ornithinimicrobium sufpigmenti TaxID=2508882 RepID=UPI00103555B7|nr:MULTISPECIES: EamA family transporter [unclassified Ornithinimicrobium]
MDLYEAGLAEAATPGEGGWSLSAFLAVGAVLVAATLFGTTGTAQALGAEGATPLGVGAVRLVIGGLGLLMVLPLVGGRRSEAIRLWRTPAGVAMGVCTALYQVSFFAAVQQAGVAIGTLAAIGSGPVLAGLLARFLLGERPRLSWVLATGLCLVGLTLLVTGGGGTRQVDLGGVALALLAGLSYAGYTVLAKGQLSAGHEPSTVMAAAFGLGGLLLVPLLVTQPTAWLLDPRGLATATHLGLVTTTLAYLLFARGLAELPAGPVTTLMLAEPVVATTLGVVVLDERLTLISTAGVGLLLLGLVLQGLGAATGKRRERASRSDPASNDAREGSASTTT